LGRNTKGVSRSQCVNTGCGFIICGAAGAGHLRFL
jgi:hypothetical protein